MLKIGAKKITWRSLLIGALLLAGVWQTGEAAYIHLKAQLAQHLLRTAWEKTRAGEKEVKPWPWADTWPVARLRVPSQGVDLYVLAGASGRTLAFGPGHLSGTPLPGQTGNSVLSAHRDTHFNFVKKLEAGNQLLVESPDGKVKGYRISAMQVVDKHDTWVTRNSENARLTLITCYPFDAILPGGPLRYVVTAEANYTGV
ncbi:class GN sortase [Sulfurirhabdus autotrophica]|uniref:Sortase A n=1 Tax=Sulfurirhabdus autotrophica TaxID=1706046 RepID=A0A4R3Y450_9PROT|nr:class GN sortase [Sulfurirhabdus autotrophica]TCV85124.1 sortase A [Sulfurirhabdus autotrophica]